MTDFRNLQNWIKMNFKNLPTPFMLKPHKIHQTTLTAICCQKDLEELLKGVQGEVCLEVHEEDGKNIEIE